jgi:hypothetical protein
MVIDETELPSARLALSLRPSAVVALLSFANRNATPTKRMQVRFILPDLVGSCGEGSGECS